MLSYHPSEAETNLRQDQNRTRENAANSAEPDDEARPLSSEASQCDQELRKITIAIERIESVSELLTCYLASRQKDDTYQGLVKYIWCQVSWCSLFIILNSNTLFESLESAADMECDKAFIIGNCLNVTFLCSLHHEMGDFRPCYKHA